MNLAGAHCSISGAVVASGRWSALLPSPKSIKLFVIKSRCYFAIKGEQIVVADRGDILVVRHGNPYMMSSALGTPLGGDVAFLHDNQLANDAYQSSACVALACFVSLNEHTGNILMKMLPNSIVVRACEENKTWLAGLYDQLVSEVRANDIGAKLAIDTLTQLIFLRVLRAYSRSLPANKATTDSGWFGKPHDERIAAIVAHMNERPLDPWTLQSLSESCNMSRTTFAKRFRLSMGITPHAYLRDIKMKQAALLLIQSDCSVANIGYHLGYESESAFSAAFKKAMNVSPGHYRASMG
ncbi:AraC-type DNA-binding protein [Collimonas sp. OK607]|nr:AraC-type DNA-binding protein [Collimonas sp. OK607]